MQGKTVGFDLIDPVGTLLEITNAIPEECRKNLTLIGSLAVGFAFHDLLQGFGIRTKDADCLILPRIDAIAAGKKITEQLIQFGWKFKPNGDWGQPGNSGTPSCDLPAVRLFPPGGHFGLPSFGFIS